MECKFILALTSRSFFDADVSGLKNKILNLQKNNMKRLKRNPEKFGPLELFSAIARENKLQIGKSDDLGQFVKLVVDSLEKSQDVPTLLHGKRVESLFAFVAAALGRCALVKSEDAGDVFFKGKNIQAPDYRVILDDGNQYLIEVKNFHSNYLSKKFTLSKEYYSRIEGYANLHKVPLKISIYFSRLNRWVLLSPSSFEKTHKGLEISLPSALARNEMSLLGDVMIATLPALRLEMMTSDEEACEIGVDGLTKIVFRSAKIFCADVEIIDEMEQRIAFYLMRFGRWTQEAEPVVKNERLYGMIFKSYTDELFEGQPFSAVGELSSMVSEAYAEHTVVDGRLVAIDAPIDPEFLALAIPHDYQGKQLPLWRFQVEPNLDFVEGA